MKLELTVPGAPVPQGSTRSFVARRTGRVVTVPDNPKMMPWRAAVGALALQARPDGWPLRAPVTIDALYLFDRPAGHYGARGTVLPSAPTRKVTRPDVDKLDRAILDALTGVLYADDAQVVRLAGGKDFADGVGARLILRVETLP